MDALRATTKNKPKKACTEGASSTLGTGVSSTQILPGPKKPNRKPRVSKTEVVSQEPGGPIKRKPGRPRKNPLPLVPSAEPLPLPFVPSTEPFPSPLVPAAEPLPPPLAIVPLPAGSELVTTSKVGREVKKSEKAFKQFIAQASKHQADQLITARRRLKDLRAGFTL